MGIDEFVKKVQTEFVREKPNLLVLAQAAYPEAYVFDMVLDGPYATGNVGPDDPVSIRVFYAGWVHAHDVARVLTGRLFGFGGSYIVVADKVEWANISFPHLKSLLAANTRYKTELRSKLETAGRVEKQIEEHIAIKGNYYNVP